jgi:hypothetical protein
MAYLLKGALIEYASDFLGPLPNVVLFQFNPERVTRTIDVPPRPTGASGRETSQAGDVPVEQYQLTAQFSAADLLAAENPLAVAAGVGPQLAALEMMVRPSGRVAGLIGEVIDAVGDALGLGAGGDDPTQPIPREQYPRLLFIWGLTRVLPVFIHSMSITEILHDRRLNPIEAEVSLGLTVISPDPCGKDDIAEGAYEYSMLVKDGLATLNLANTAAQVAEMIGGVIEEIAF